jgi:hypothetical protein
MKCGLPSGTGSKDVPLPVKEFTPVGRQTQLRRNTVNPASPPQPRGATTRRRSQKEGPKGAGRGFAARASMSLAVPEASRGAPYYTSVRGRGDAVAGKAGAGGPKEGYRAWRMLLLDGKSNRIAAGDDKSNPWWSAMCVRRMRSRGVAGSLGPGAAGEAPAT